MEDAAGLDRGAARETIYGEPYAQWKAKHVGPATPEQLARMAESLTRNPPPPVQG